MNITKKEKRELISDVADAVLAKINGGALKLMAWDVFATIGLDELEKIVDQGYENRDTVGHTNYINLAEVYEKRLRTMAIERLQEMLNKLTEVPNIPVK